MSACRIKCIKPLQSIYTIIDGDYVVMAYAMFRYTGYPSFYLLITLMHSFPFYKYRQDAAVALWDDQAEAFSDRVVHGYGNQGSCRLPLCCHNISVVSRYSVILMPMLPWIYLFHCIIYMTSYCLPNSLASFLNNPRFTDHTLHEAVVLRNMYVLIYILL